MSRLAKEQIPLLCPFCQILTKRKYTIPAYQFDVFECLRCKLQIKAGAPTEKDPYRYYNKSYFDGTSTQSSQESARKILPDSPIHAPKKNYRYCDERQQESANQLVWQSRLKKLAQYIPPPARLLDVGCAFGGFVHSARKFGYQAWGIDVSDYAVAQGQKRGLPILKAKLESLSDSMRLHGQSPEKKMDKQKKALLWSKFAMNIPFDIVTMIETLEHIADPNQAFRALNRLLSPRGLLVIQTANFAGWQAKHAGCSYHYYLPGHFFYYSKENLVQILERYDFSLQRFYHPVDFSLSAKIKKIYNLQKKRGSLLRNISKGLWYHLISFLAFGNFAMTSSMVLYLRKNSSR